MSFNITAQNMRVDNGHILKARLKEANGNEVDAEIDLNSIIGNNNGRFEWGGADFSKSAEEIHFAVEGAQSVPVLRALLKNLKGELVRADINLAERIENDNGHFRFQ